MAECAICEKKPGRQSCDLEGAAVCVECCLEVKNVYLCQACKWFEKPRGASRAKG